MSECESRELVKKQTNNTAKLVITTFYKIFKGEEVTSQDITNHLQEKFGDVWNVSVLADKAEETLQKSAALGFLERRGDGYIASLVREIGRRRRRRRRCSRRRRRRCR